MRRRSHEHAGRLGRLGRLPLVGIGVAALLAACLPEMGVAPDASAGPGTDGGSPTDATVGDAPPGSPDAPGGDGTFGDASGDALQGSPDAMPDAVADSPASICGDASFSLCDGGCVAINTPENCGACGVACSPGDGAPATCDPEDGGYVCGIQCPSGDHGCNGNCYPNSDPPGTAGDPCVISPTFAVFVSAGGEDSNDGTPAHPLHTLAAALVRVSSPGGPGRIYACASAGGYPERVTIASPVDVYGGFSCAGGTWAYAPDGSVQALVDPDAGVPLTILAPNGPVNVTTMAFRSADGAPDSGASSVAAFVSAGDAAVLFTHVTLTAGAGGSGVAGVVPSVNYVAGASAEAGDNATSNAGAAFVTCSCLDSSLGAGGVQTSTGGNGGDGELTTAPGPLPGGNGVPVPVGVGSPGSGDGGVYNLGTSQCGNGAAGASGDSGVGGVATPLDAGISEAGWWTAGGFGGPGTGGAVGQGGGGGSGGANTGDPTGGGGGGGCGGCGGEWGSGGGPGGSSVGVVVFQSLNLQINNSTVIAGVGGAGGPGANGQIGQTGGVQGTPSGLGCQGGRGGLGGSGGGGAGGAGGASYGLVYTLMHDAGSTFGSVLYTPAGGGAGGRAGTGGGAQSGLPGDTKLTKGF